MTSRGATGAQDVEDRNPFASSRTRPDAVAYRFAAGASAEVLVDAFLAQGRQGQIVGPHGSGKSTLMWELARELARRGIETLRIDLHDGQRRLPRPVWESLRDPARAGQVTLVDGYEQLGFWQKRRLRRAASRRGGLLVTAHGDCRLPTLVQTSSDCGLALELARRFDPGVAPDEVQRAFTSHHGNLREVWFALYDLYERRRSQRLPAEPPAKRP